MQNIDAQAIINRIRRLRTQFAGHRGKSKFARALGISPSTYSYYEHDRIPPIETLLAICRITGADLYWLLTGSQGSLDVPIGPTAAYKALFERLSTLLADNPDLDQPVAAFVDLLCEKKGIEARLTPTPTQTPGPKRSWIPVLGRTAAGIVHCWDQTALPRSSEAVTKLEELVTRHTGRKIVGTADGPVAADFDLAELSAAIADTRVSLVRVSSGAPGKVVEFVDCDKIAAAFPDCFALHVDGDSMSPRIKDGDVIIASPSVPAADGQVAIAHITDQIGVTCKLIRTTAQGVHLIPINEKYDTKIVPHKNLLWAISVLCHVNL